MKAAQAQFLKFLRTGEQFIIPIYQRTYSWDTAQCEQLWNDIVRAASDDGVAGHFVGSVVYVEHGIYQVSGVTQLLVIDGQQRLTTLTLLLAALAELLKRSGAAPGLTAEQITDHYLLNRHNEGQGRYRLLLTQSDRDTLIRLVDGLPPPEPASRRILGNYEFFRQRLERSGLEAVDVFRGLQKLVIVDISLDRTHDDPQLIFESLNSTGLELSQADLIRNYVLMGQPPGDMEVLYKDYWFPMEQRFGQTDYTSVFDRFMRDYLTVKDRRIPNIREVYKDFKAHARSGTAGAIPTIVADVARVSRCFVNIALGKEPDSELREAFAEINTLKVDVAYPFLLEIYEHYAAGRVDRRDFLAVVHLVESYIVRRVICGIPTNSLNKTFVTLAQSLEPSNLVDSLGAAFAAMDSYRRFPSDEEFEREFVVKDIYDLRIRNYLLRKLENHGHKDRVVVEGYTIEHIMPQNVHLPPAWRADLGENWQAIQSRYLNTIGNLTLTMYNPEMSDKPFLEKRDMPGGLRRTPLDLNDQLGNVDLWNEAEIRKRGSRLAKRALEVWPAPVLSSNSRAFYDTKAQATATAYTLADHHYLTGPMLELFQQLRMRVLNLDSSVREEILKLYVAYKTTTNLVDVVPQANRLRLSLNMRFHEVDDPTGICRDVTNLGRWGNGDVEVGLTSAEQLEDVMYLVLQAFDKQREGVET
jgi:uncharacterized protein with ParB-like and HNH nuclease domain/predicted transport protein